MFLAVAIGAIAIAVAVMLGFIVLNSVKTAVAPSAGQIYVNVDNISNGTHADALALNTTLNNAQGTVFSGLNLVVIGVIVLAAFGLIAIFGKR